MILADGWLRGRWCPCCRCRRHRQQCRWALADELSFSHASRWLCTEPAPPTLCQPAARPQPDDLHRHSHQIDTWDDRIAAGLSYLIAFTTIYKWVSETHSDRGTEKETHSHTHRERQKEALTFDPDEYSAVAGPPAAVDVASDVTDVRVTVTVSDVTDHQRSVVHGEAGRSHGHSRAQRQPRITGKVQRDSRTFTPRAQSLPRDPGHRPAPDTTFQLQLRASDGRLRPRSRPHTWDCYTQTHTQAGMGTKTHTSLTKLYPPMNLLAYTPCWNITFRLVVCVRPTL